MRPYPLFKAFLKGILSFFQGLYVKGICSFLLRHFYYKASYRFKYNGLKAVFIYIIL